MAQGSRQNFFVIVLHPIVQMLWIGTYFTGHLVLGLLHRNLFQRGSTS